MLRSREAKGALFVSALSLLALVKARADIWPHPTCTGYLRAIELSTQYNDPYLKQSYLDLANQMYALMNQESIERGMKPLPTVANADAQANRAMLVVSVCEDDTDATYTEAVLDAYQEMREASGLSFQLLHRQ
jgi:hypothetical protein